MAILPELSNEAVFHAEEVTSFCGVVGERSNHLLIGHAGVEVLIMPIVRLFVNGVRLEFVSPIGYIYSPLLRTEHFVDAASCHRTQMVISDLRNNTMSFLSPCKRFSGEQANGRYSRN